MSQQHKPGNSFTACKGFTATLSGSRCMRSASPARRRLCSSAARRCRAAEAAPRSAVAAAEVLDAARRAVAWRGELRPGKPSVFHIGEPFKGWFFHRDFQGGFSEEMFQKCASFFWNVQVDWNGEIRRHMGEKFIFQVSHSHPRRAGCLNELALVALMALMALGLQEGCQTLIGRLEPQRSRGWWSGHGPFGKDFTKENLGDWNNQSGDLNKHMAI